MSDAREREASEASEAVELRVNDPGVSDAREREASEASEAVELRVNDPGVSDARERERPYRRLSPLTPLARSGIVLFAAVAATWRELLRGDLGPFGLVLLALLVAGAVYGVASWVRTKYWVESDELRVDTGVIARQSRRIRIDRLQGVDIVQPLVARLFGLAELRMDVAGGGRREGSLAFLKLSDARELQQVLLARRDSARGSPSPSADGPAEPGEVATTPGQQAPERLLAQVPLSLLVSSTLLTTEALALAVILLLAVVSAGFGFLEALTAALPAIGGLAVVLVRKVVASYGFTVADTANGLQVRRGLFELSSQTIALSRLQGVVVSEPLLWRALGWARLDVSIAGYAEASSGEDAGPAASTLLPVGDRRLVTWLARQLLDGVDPDATPMTRPPDRARWVSPVGRHFAAAGTSADLLASRQGWFVRRTHLVPHARVQSLRLTQGPLQRRLGLADLHVDSPPGPAHVRASDRWSAEARDLLEREIVASARARRPQRIG